MATTSSSCVIDDCFVVESDEHGYNFDAANRSWSMQVRLGHMQPLVNMQPLVTPNQTSDATLFVWHNGLTRPLEVMDASQQPLRVPLDEPQGLLASVQERILKQPQLRRLFPHVTPETIHQAIQICERSGNGMKWTPLHEAVGSPTLKKNQDQPRQLLVEAKFDEKKQIELPDWRCGRFYSDIQENQWRFELGVGQFIDAQDANYKWFESRIVDTDVGFVQVHYRGWSSQREEWLPRTSTRVAPLLTKTRNWRAFQVGDELLVGTEVVGKPNPEWRDAIVTACAYEGKALHIEVFVNGTRQWMDAQDELLCPQGTHKVINADSNIVESVPYTINVDYFERSKKVLSVAVHEDKSGRDAACITPVVANGVDANDWCAVRNPVDKLGGNKCMEKEFSRNLRIETNRTQLEKENDDIVYDQIDTNEQLGQSDQIAAGVQEPIMNEPKDEAWREELHVGQLVDALDTDNKWYESRVVDLNSLSVKLHYRGWTSKLDEWISKKSNRIAPLHTKITNWRAFTVGDGVMVGREWRTKSIPEWRNAIVEEVTTNLDGTAKRIKVATVGRKQWMDVQDEMLCPLGTHKAVI
ncbi:hypothetical protein CCR75_007580 [Bremia lactucae]|uniref:Uncharacterized protein n=1 Tax=Bremia lactucae TaxID=4779 RepID=A0A976FKL2_BRELC|nr:hypothetical protein CCR75_007580 [Bremia lactucae]